MTTGAISPALHLDPETCRRARLSRDPRFDGEFFLAVRTTGIYCRPVCPARPPTERNVSYYRSAAEAARDGYRPCLRCRPETAPGSAAWRGASTTVRRAIALIGDGALNGQPVAALAERLGIGERYLRKLFERELGISPAALALNQRLLLAKQLLAETRLPVTEVALAAGFSSVRRFNDAVRGHFRLSPTALRRRSGRPEAGAPVHLRLRYRPPYDWDGVLEFFARHAVAGIEAVDGHTYRRSIAADSGVGWLTVAPVPGQDALALSLEVPDQRMILPTVSRVRRMFDLDANPAVIAEGLGADPDMAALLRQRPGVRAPGYWSFYEAAVRAVVGQQVSTTAARGVLGRLAEAADRRPVFPAPEALAALPDCHFRMPASRRETLRAVCRLFVEGEPAIEALAAVRGVGPWTTAMTAMRGAGETDRLPVGDLGLKRAWESLASGESLAARQAAWQPWNSYAANLLWRTPA